ncbi:hypothetical protein STANM309S_06478 [Streptomyces tanashiensis]
MPISPGWGSALMIRQRKGWFRSSWVGALKARMRQPDGLKSPMTCLTVPPLPLVSMPWRTRSSRRRSPPVLDAYRRSWSSARRGPRAAVAASPAALPVGPAGVARASYAVRSIRSPSGIRRTSRREGSGAGADSGAFRFLFPPSLFATSGPFRRRSSSSPDPATETGHPHPVGSAQHHGPVTANVVPGV